MGQTEDVEQRASYLSNTTVLSEREAEVQALKEAGLTHEQIAERLEVSKSTVDEYSRRINQRLKQAKATVRQLGDE